MNLFTKNIRGFVDFGKQADDLLIKICSKKAVLLNPGSFFNITWEGGRGQVLRDVEFFY